MNNNKKKKNKAQKTSTTRNCWNFGYDLVAQLRGDKQEPLQTAIIIIIITAAA